MTDATHPTDARTTCPAPALFPPRMVAARTLAAYALLAGLAAAVVALSRPGPSRAERASADLPEVAMQGHVAAVHAAIARGADVNASDLYGITPLHRAAVAGQVDTTRALIAHGACLEAQSFPQGTPLADAACFGMDSTVRVLLDAGANPNSRSIASGQTPLVAAIFADSPACVRALLIGGADPNLPGPSGLSPLRAAIESHGSPEILDLLRRAGAIDGSSAPLRQASTVAWLDE